MVKVSRPKKANSEKNPSATLFYCLVEKKKRWFFVLLHHSSLMDQFRQKVHNMCQIFEFSFCKIFHRIFPYFFFDFLLIFCYILRKIIEKFWNYFSSDFSWFFKQFSAVQFFNVFYMLHTLFEKSNFCPKIWFWQNPNIFTSFSSKIFLTIFLVKSKLSTAKKSKTTTFSRFF